MSFLEWQAAGETPARRLLQIVGFAAHAVPIVRFVFQADWEGLENVPRDGPAIIAPNHTSVADASLVAVPIFLDQNCRMVQYIAARDQLEGRWGRYIRFFSSIPVSPDVVDWRSYRAAMESFEAGRLVGMYPEGGISRDGRPRPFLPIVAWMAINAGVPLVPVTVNGMHQIWPPQKKWPRRCVRAQVIYHPAIPCQEMRHLRNDREAIEDVSRRLEETVTGSYRLPADSR